MQVANADKQEVGVLNNYQLETEQGSVQNDEWQWNNYSVENGCGFTAHSGKDHTCL